MFQKKGQFENKYKPKRKQTKPRKHSELNDSKFRWIDHPVGMVAKVVMAFAKEYERGSAETALTRVFSEDAGAVYNQVVRLIPCLPAVYLKGRKQPLTVEIVNQRVHKMFYENDSDNPAKISKEHPVNNKRLKHLLEPVKRLLENKVTLSYDDCVKVCEITFPKLNFDKFKQLELPYAVTTVDKERRVLDVRSNVGEHTSRESLS
jgi:hypothetical protein